jgi:hypothetical protein
MEFALVYTRRVHRPAHDASPALFVDWHPPLAFEAHWCFANGGGMGIVEAASSAEIEKAIAPLAMYFDFTLEQIGEPVPARRPLAAGALATVA